MEIVLQWLDELDDLVAAGIFRPTLLRGVLLVAALAAAAATPLLLKVGILAPAALALVNISLVCLIGWAFVGSLAFRSRSRSRSNPGNA